jgi:outer membrane protein assembly factor BamB
MGNRFCRSEGLLRFAGPCWKSGRRVAVVALLLVGVGGLWANDWRQIVTRPPIPDVEDLERLNLERAWSTYVPMDGRRDSIFTVQALGRQVIVQTTSGLVAALDAERGQIQWFARPGNPYRTAHPVAFNSQTVFVVNGTDLYALERATGKQKWKYEMPGSAVAPPTADEYQLYLSLGTGKLYTYLLPSYLEIERAPTREGKKLPRPEFGPDQPPITFSLLEAYRASRTPTPAGVIPEPQPYLVFETSLVDRLERAPLLGRETMLLLGESGLVLGLNKFVGKELYRFPIEAPVTVDPGHAGEMGYLAMQDFILYAFNIPEGRVLWRYPSGSSFLRKPEVNDKDVFVVNDRRGLQSIDRATGDLRWDNPDVSRFMAANPKFVYAEDRRGNMLVLDRLRGTALGWLCTRGFVVPISNERTDRVYLGANNGLIVCMHDRDYLKPVVMKSGWEKLEPEGTGVSKPEPAGTKPTEGKPPEGKGEDDKKPR